MRTWTIESAKAYIAMGKRGLKYCSALDYLRSHGETVEKPIITPIKQKKSKKPFWKKKRETI